MGFVCTWQFYIKLAKFSEFYEITNSRGQIFFCIFLLSGTDYGRMMAKSLILYSLNSYPYPKYIKSLVFVEIMESYGLEHGLRTPNEGINQRYLKNWADVADKICFGRT